MRGEFFVSPIPCSGTQGIFFVLRSYDFFRGCRHVIYSTSVYRAVTFRKFFLKQPILVGFSDRDK